MEVERKHELIQGSACSVAPTLPSVLPKLMRQLTEEEERRESLVEELGTSRWRSMGKDTAAHFNQDSNSHCFLLASVEQDFLST